MIHPRHRLVTHSAGGVVLSSRAGIGCGAASKTATRANFRSPRRASICRSDLRPKTGEETGFWRCGLSMTEHAGATLRKRPRRDDRQARQCAGNRTGKASGRRWKSGVFSPSDRTADPSPTAPSFARNSEAACIRIARRARHRDDGRPIERRGDRESNIYHDRRRVGFNLLSPTRHPLPQASIRSSILSCRPVRMIEKLLGKVADF